MYENFDRSFLDQPPFVEKRAARDAILQKHNISPDDFREWLREHDVLNETDTDEYRETQPGKGLAYVADFMSDFAPGRTACLHVMQLTNEWLRVMFDGYSNPDEWNKKIGFYAYAGADELAPILNICFDFLWEQGRVGLYYDDLDDSLIEQWIDAHSNDE